MSGLTCSHDSGSATGCEPLCDAPAVWSVTYSNGSYNGLTAVVCDAHLPVTRARIYPGRLESVTPICVRCGHDSNRHESDYGCNHVGTGTGNSRAAVSRHYCHCTAMPDNARPIVTDQHGWPLGLHGPGRPYELIYGADR